MASLDLEARCTSDIALEELLDLKDPLRHLMHQQDDELQGVISAEDELARVFSASQLLNALPQHHTSVEDSVLKLSFLHQWNKVPNPLSIALHVDASPGCGGLAWPAGQVQSLSSLLPSCLYSMDRLICLDSGELLGAKRA